MTGDGIGPGGYARFDPEATLTIGRRRGRTLLLLLGSVVFVAAGAQMAAGNFVPSGRDPAFVAFIGWVCLLFFGAAGIAIGVSLVRPGAALTLDRSGVTILSPIVKPTRLGWGEIAEVAEIVFKRQHMLVFYLVDTEAFLGRLSAAARRAADYSIALVGSPVSIPTWSLAIERDVLRHEIERRLAWWWSARTDDDDTMAPRSEPPPNDAAGDPFAVTLRPDERRLG